MVDPANWIPEGQSITPPRVLKVPNNVDRALLPSNTSNDEPDGVCKLLRVIPTPNPLAGWDSIVTRQSGADVP